MDQAEIRDLPVTLTEEELLSRARTLATMTHDIVLAEFEKKLAAKNAKKVIDDLKTHVNAISTIVSSGKEHRPVECVWQADYTKNMLRLIRVDTSELVTSRAMTREERQTELSLEAPADQPKPAKGRKGFAKGGKGRLEDMPPRKDAPAGDA